MKRFLFIDACLFSVVVCAAGAQAATYSVTDLGTLGGTISYGYDINANGQVTGYSYMAGDAAYHAFLYDGTMHDLGSLGGANSYGYGINASGQVTGYSYMAGDAAYHAFLYDNTMHDLGTFGGTKSIGFGINDSGHVTGYAYTTGDWESHTFLYDNTMHDLGKARGYGINASGQVTGMPNFLWTPTVPNGTSGVMQDLGTLGGFPPVGFSINASGEVTGSASLNNIVNGPSHAFLFDGTIHDLGTLGSSNSYGLDINDSGQIVGYCALPAPSLHTPFLYTSAAGMVNLNTLIAPLSGWALIQADAINNAGQITGYGTIGGRTHAFLLNPPSTWNGNGGSSNWSTASDWTLAPSRGSNLNFTGSTRLSNSNDSLTEAGSITFSSTAGVFTLSGNALTISGGIANNSVSAQTINLNLTLSAAQQFNAASGNLTVNGTVANGGKALTVTGSSNTTLAGDVSGTGALVKSGAGTLTVLGNNGFSGGTTVTAGTLIVGHIHALGSGGLTINSAAKATLQSGLSGPVQLPSLTIQGGTAPTGKLDITDNNLIVHNGNLSTLTAQIKSGFIGGGSLWTGPGIASSSAAADANYFTAVGIMSNDDGSGGALHSTWPAGADSGGAVSVTNTDVLIKYTYFGDADLNGVVDNSTDYLLWSSGYSNHLTGWLYGDFDYSGVVDNSTDYLLWSTGFSNQGSPLSGGVQPVPEPSTLVLAALGLAATIIRVGVSRLPQPSAVS